MAKTIPYIKNFNEWVNEFSFSTEVKVRFSETDAFGHLNNTNAFVYFEEARIDFFKHLGLMDEWLKEESSTIVVTADLQCNYLRQVFFDEKLSVYVKVNHVGNTSLDIHYLAVNNEGSYCLTGRGAIVQISKFSGKSVPWNEEMLSDLNEKQASLQ